MNLLFVFSYLPFYIRFHNRFCCLLLFCIYPVVTYFPVYSSRLLCVFCVLWFQVYLNAINKKTQQAQSANFDDLGDVSISSGRDGNLTAARRPRSSSPAGAAAVTPSPAASKFLKKKSPQTATDGENPIVIAGRKKHDSKWNFSIINMLINILSFQQ